MPIKVIASSANKCPSWDAVKKRIDERRVVLENARNMNIARLNNDVERIAKRELEFTRQLFEELVPYKLQWDTEALEKIKETLPVRIVPNKRAPSPPETSPVTETETSVDI